jgi:hypothetical protein
MLFHVDVGIEIEIWIFFLRHIHKCFNQRVCGQHFLLAHLFLPDYKIIDYDMLLVLARYELTPVSRYRIV